MRRRATPRRGPERVEPDAKAVATTPARRKPPRRSSAQRIQELAVFAAPAMRRGSGHSSSSNNNAAGATATSAEAAACGWAAWHTVDDITVEEGLSRLLDKVRRAGGPHAEAFLPVTKVVQGSAAALAGVSAGDLVLSINGHTAVHPLSMATRPLRLVVCKGSDPRKAVVIALEPGSPGAGLFCEPSPTVAMAWLQARSRGLTNVLDWDSAQLVHHLLRLGEFELVIEAVVTAKALSNSSAGFPVCLPFGKRSAAAASSSERIPLAALHGAALVETGLVEDGRQILDQFLRRDAPKCARVYVRIAKVYLIAANLALGITAAEDSHLVEELVNTFAEEEVVRRKIDMLLRKLKPLEGPQTDAGSTEFVHPLIGVKVPSYSFSLSRSDTTKATKRAEALGCLADGNKVDLQQQLAKLDPLQLILVVFVGGSSKATKARYEDAIARVIELRDTVLASQVVHAVHVLTADALPAQLESATHRSLVVQTDEKALDTWQEILFRRAAGVGREEVMDADFADLPALLWLDKSGIICGQGIDDLPQVLAEVAGLTDHERAIPFVPPPPPTTAA